MDTKREEEAQVMTISDAAQIAGVTEDAIRKAITRGKLPSQIMLGRKVVQRKDLEAYQKAVKIGRPAKKLPEKD